MSRVVEAWRSRVWGVSSRVCGAVESQSVERGVAECGAWSSRVWGVE